MTKILVAIAGVALVAASAIPAFGSTRTVAVRDTFFKPKTISIAKGTTMKWVWRGTLPHNVTVKKGPARFHSRTVTKGSFSHTFTRKGRYTIVCTIHQALGMKMVVNVT
jgi:plastocyanin